VSAIDREVEASTIVESLRSGSRRNGGALLTAHARMGTPGAAAYRERVRSGDALGHLAVAQALVWRPLGLTEGEAVAISGYGLVSALMAAAIRLGAVGAIEAQVIAARLLDVVAAAAAAPVADGRPLRSFVPLAEIAAMRHGGCGQRLFAN
ncbi:MAG: urease accessory protein UreF, partial [Rhizobiales bacterium]|nr:urease accessory protein UreF [Hyphomicrobiales bacterium]